MLAGTAPRRAARSRRGGGRLVDAELPERVSVEPARRRQPPVPLELPERPPGRAAEDAVGRAQAVAQDRQPPLGQEDRRVASRVARRLLRGTARGGRPRREEDPGGQEDGRQGRGERAGGPHSRTSPPPGRPRARARATTTMTRAAPAR